MGDNIQYLFQAQPPIYLIFSLIQGSGGWSHSQHALAKSQVPSQDVLYTFTGHICIYIYKQTDNAFNLESPVHRVYGLWEKPELPEEIRLTQVQHANSTGSIIDFWTIPQVPWGMKTAGWRVYRMLKNQTYGRFI